MDFVAEFLQLLDSLNRHQVQYVIVGGAALNVHGLIRATEDVDVFVKPTRKNIEAFKKALRQLWDDPSIDEIDAGELMGKYPVIRYGPPRSSMYIDVMTSVGEVADYEDLDWEVVCVRNTDIRVATPKTLYRLKKNTVRPIDRADAARLAEAFDFGKEE